MPSCSTGQSAKFLLRNLVNSIVTAAQGGCLKAEAADVINAAYGSPRAV